MAEHKHKHKHKQSVQPPNSLVQHVQTLSHAHDVCTIDMRTNECNTAVILIAGQRNGDVSLYTAPISCQKQRQQQQRVQFTLRKQWHAHTCCVTCLHLHYSKPVFVSTSSDKTVKVQSIQDVTTPRLIKNLPHPEVCWCVKYSRSGLLLTCCDDGVIRVYDKEPLLSLRWTSQTLGDIYSVSWSPANRIAASVRSESFSYFVQAWDSSFCTLFKRAQENIVFRNNGLVFASNDLLICSGADSNMVCWYYMCKPKIMSALKTSLPLCTDVLKIIITYLPLVTHMTNEPYSDTVGAVTALSSQLVCSSCEDDMLRIYKLHGNGNERCLLTSLSHKYCDYLVSCVCPGKETGFLLASTGDRSKDVHVAVTSSL